MFKTLGKLYEVNLATPIGLARLGLSLSQSGSNLMAVLQFAARTYPERTAIVDDKETILYKDLYVQCQQLAHSLHQQYGIIAGKKIGILCRNNAAIVKAIVALSRLAADVYLLNPAMTKAQLNQLHEQHEFDLIVHDLAVWKVLQSTDYEGKTLLSYHLTFPSIDSLSKPKKVQKVDLPKGGQGNLVVLSGGTTGAFKSAARKPSVSNFLNPFFALLKQLELGQYQSVYIATPVFHGFGLASMIMSMVLGSKMLLLERFDLAQITRYFLKHKIEVVIVVPVLLRRLLQLQKLEWIYIRCVLCGGAPLAPDLVEQTFAQYKYDLANLYGSSEAGFSIMATTADLKKYPNSIGKPIQGVSTQIVNTQQEPVEKGTIGHLLLKSKWSMQNSIDTWINTGDLAYENEEGFFFHCGRSDEMIVSGGENVYPIELEQILQQHSSIATAAVIGIPDETFGQGLKAFISLYPNEQLTKDTLEKWLKEHTAPHQFPKAIEFLDELPRTSIGKVNKKVLS